MRTYQIKDSDDHLFAFEIDNAYVSIRKLSNILSGLDGVTEVKGRKLFQMSCMNLLEFKYKNRSYVVWEPHDDSSRYWIGPESEDSTLDISDIERLINKYEPNIFIRILGDILTLNIFKTKRDR